jgi:VanZ family protein
MSETSRIIGPILRFLFPNAPEATITAYHALIRKSAHFTEYAILAFWAIKAFSASPAADFLRKNRFWLATLLVVCVASVDEFHQSFVPSRTSSIWDVALDSAGGVTMVLLFWLFTKSRSYLSQTAAPSRSE